MNELIEIAMSGLDNLMYVLEKDANLIFEYIENGYGGVTIEISTLDECMGTDFLCGFEFDENGYFINEY